MDHPMTICVDLDGTILEDAFPDLGPPKDGVAEALSELMEMGFEIKILTCRMNGNMRDEGLVEEQFNAIIDHLTVLGIPFDSIALPEEGKPLAYYYVDDKGVRFDGNWAAIVDFIRARGTEKEASRARERKAKVKMEGIAKRIVRKTLRQKSDQT